MEFHLFFLLTCMSSIALAQNPGPAATWSVKDANGNVCLLASLNANFTIFYNATHPASTNDTYVAKSVLLQLPSTATVVQERSFCNSGSILADTQRIVLQWSAYKHNLTLLFEQNPNTSMSTNVGFTNATLEYDVNDESMFPGHTAVEDSLITAKSTNNIATIGSHKYMQCLTGFTTQLTIPDEKVETYNASMLLTNVRLQAFRNSTDTNFNGDAEVCPGDASVTTVAPIVTSTATPAPPLVGAFYNLTFPNGSQCLMVHFDLSITAMYYKYDSNVAVNGTVASVNNGTINHTLSYCSQEQIVLVIERFLPDWRLRMQFENSSGKAYLSDIQLIYNLSSSWKFPDAAIDSNRVHQLNATKLNRWSAALGHSYKCLNRADNIKMDVNAQRALESMTLSLNQVRLRAFVPVNGSVVTNGTMSWGQDEECGMDILTNDIVPIAVGCALAALVVIVLIAYVIGRRRNRARGYESM